MLKMMYGHDFSELAPPSTNITMNSNEVSVEEQTFLHIFQKRTVKKDDQYVVPLSFRD